VSKVERVPDAVLRLPTKQCFVIRKEGKWVLSDKAGDVFDLEPGEYLEVELPVADYIDHDWENGKSVQKRKPVMLTYPVEEALARLETIPGVTHAVDRSQHMYDHHAPPELHSSAGVSDRFRRYAAIGGEVATAYDTPYWHDPHPAPEDAPRIAEVVAKVGGRLGWQRPYHPTDSGYSKIADALAPFGIIIDTGTGSFVHDPVLAEKRAKGRARRKQYVAGSEDRARRQREEAQRADEEELKTIHYADLEFFDRALASALASGVVAALLASESDPRVCAYGEGAGRVRECYDAWVLFGSDPVAFGQRPVFIGRNNAAAEKVVATFVARLGDHYRRVANRARRAKVPKPKPRFDLRYWQHVGAVVSEFYADAAAYTAAEEARAVREAEEEAKAQQGVA